jgi:membrane associated rhomboid family serine protease
MVRLLIAWNAIFFFVQLLAGRFALGHPMLIGDRAYFRLDEVIDHLLGLMPSQVIGHGWIWQLVTYMFLHGGFFHILLNMLALWMFGSELEHLWGSKRFLQYYFITGIGAGLTNTLVQPHSTIPIIGASGAIYGLLLAYGMYFPDRRIYLWLIVPIPAKYFVIIFGGLEFISAFSRNPDGVAHIAHLGGILFGFLYLRLYRRGWFRPRKRSSSIFDIRDYRDDDRDKHWR